MQTNTVKSVNIHREHLCASLTSSVSTAMSTPRQFVDTRVKFSTPEFLKPVFEFVPRFTYQFLEQFLCYLYINYGQLIEIPAINESLAPSEFAAKYPKWLSDSFDSAISFFRMFTVFHFIRFIQAHFDVPTEMRIFFFAADEISKYKFAVRSVRRNYAMISAIRLRTNRLAIDLGIAIRLNADELVILYRPQIINLQNSRSNKWNTVAAFHTAKTLGEYLLSFVRASKISTIFYFTFGSSYTIEVHESKDGKICIGDDTLDDLYAIRTRSASEVFATPLRVAPAELPVTFGYDGPENCWRIFFDNDCAVYKRRFDGKKTAVELLYLFFDYDEYVDFELIVYMTMISEDKFHLSEVPTEYSVPTTAAHLAIALFDHVHSEMTDFLLLRSFVNNLHHYRVSTDSALTEAWNS